jgi:hypothetical protein
MKTLLEDFSAKVPVIANESLHEGNYDNGIRVINFAVSKYLIVKSTRH